MFAFGCASTLSAQNAPHPSFRQYTTSDGLASSEVYWILEDRKGFIWISSDNGASRFDGYRFRNFGLKDGLKENVIFVMQLDTMGRVWMQAMSGNLYYMDGDTILPYWNNGVLNNFKDRRDYSMGFIVEGAGETVHIATLGYGVITISKDGKAKTYDHPEPAHRQVFEKNGIAINALFNREGAEGMQAFAEKLLRQNRCMPVYFHVNGEEWRFPDFIFSKKEGRAIGAFRLGDGKYFFQMFNDVWFIENGKIRWQCYFPFHILDARLMKNGQLFVGLHYHQGLRVYKSIEAFRKEEGATWLTGQTVSHFTEDREGGRWFATNDSGIFYTPADAFLVHDSETGLPNEKVTALAIKNENEVYTGLVNGEVWHLDRKAGNWTELPEIPDVNFVKDLHFDPQNQQLWAGRNNLFFLQKNKWVLMAAPYQKGTLSISNHITESPGGQRLWVCNHLGFMSIELSPMRPSNIHTGHDQRTYVVREDFTGRVWVGQPKGLFEWRGSTLLGRQNLHPAFSLRVEDIALMPDSTLAVATKGGGVVFWKGSQFEQITTEQGLTADMLECLWAGGDGTLWAGTLNGLNRISGAWGHRQVEQITVFHGLPSNEISRIRTLDGNVWVATSKGLVRFSNKTKNQLSPRPFLASVLANNRPVDLTRSMQLPSLQNNLTISFFAINYKMNGKIPYRYRMDGGDWATTLNRSLNFPKLPPGERLFEVQAQNEDGVWSEPATLCFEILPPWWASWWAKTIAVIAFAVIGPAFYKYRMRQLRDTHKIELQMAELERSALQAQMNPHFIFNCLNSIQNFILQNEKESAIMYLGSFASLMRSMLNASVTGEILLAEEVKLLNNYLELEKLRFKNRFTYEVSTAAGLDVFEVKIPPLLVQPYIENAVLHGISGRDAGGKVEVFFEKKERYLEVLIRDNGSGPNPENRQATSARLHKSLGMSITRNRLELLSHGKEINAVNTKLLHDEKGRATGTEVTIRIGLGEKIATKINRRK